MRQSYLYLFIKKLLEKKAFNKRKYLNLHRKNVYLFLNSNPWFSAVTDYSLQLCLYLQSQNEDIIYGAEKDSTAMDKICLEHKISFVKIPIHNLNIFNFIISFFKIVRLLSCQKNRVKHVFAFEGREHTLLILTKFLFPFLWERKKLIRVRSQSQEVKRSFFSIIAYKYYTDRIIFAAECVANRVQFTLPKNKFIIQHYCKNINYTEHKLTQYSFSEKFPILQLNHLTFFILGRFDSVKGHDMALESFLTAELKGPSNLIFIGKSEGIKAKDIYSKFSKVCSHSIEDENKYFLEKENKCVYIIDEKFKNINVFMQNTHFGIISSLDSEVVCRVGVEFLQSGVPCLYSNAGALAEVFQSFPQLNFEKGNIQSLKMKIEYAENIFKNQIEYENLKLKSKQVGFDRYGLDNLKNVFHNL